MVVLYNTLKQLIDFDHQPEQLGVLLTGTGLEVEGIHEILPVKGGLQGLLIGEVITCVQHPNADKLSCTTVDVGAEELLSIVCGAPNVAAGQKVAVATVGTTLYPSSGESFVIKKSKIRGEESNGMLCAEDEIGLGTSHAGIMVLDTTLANGTPLAKYFNMEPDYAIEIGLTPNRADAASHFGVARDIKAIIEKEVKLPSIEDFKTGSMASTIVPSINNTEACPRFCGLEIKNVKVAPSPKWLSTFLENIGVNSINNLVDISNYICHLLGQPMHIFDADQIRGQKIIVDTPSAGTTVTTLDGIERKLTGKDLCICDAEGPISIAGVFGGKNSGVNELTNHVFLEVAYFHPDFIRKTATHHGLKTDASFRYERGTDPEMPLYAIKLAANLILEIAGGEVCDTLFDLYPEPILPKNLTVMYKNIDRLLGKVLDRALIKKILQNLDIEVLSFDDNSMDLSIPAFRVDVYREADIVEEILRIYGFDQIELSENLSSDYLSDFPVVDADTEKNRIAQLLAANGFQEIQTLSIVKPSQNDILDSDSNVMLLNPLSEDLAAMRNSLLFSGLQTIAYNINRRSKDLRLFEYGRTYKKNTQESALAITEKQVLSLWLTGQTQSESWQSNKSAVSFFDLKNKVSLILKSLKYQELLAEEVSNGIFEYGIAVKAGQKQLAVLGKVNPKHLKSAGIKQDVFYAELDWSLVLKKYKKEQQYTEISKFPEVRRDLSLVIDKKTSFDQIKTLALKTERKLLSQINVFDIYEGEKLGENKKSYSVSFILQDKNSTLQDKQIDQCMNRLMSAFENELGAEIRK